MFIFCCASVLFSLVILFDVSVLQFFRRLRFDVSRERGYMYNLCSLRIAFTLPSPSPTFLLRYLVSVLFHGQCNKK